MKILSGNKRTPDGYLIIVIENLNEESKNKILQILNDDYDNTFYIDKMYLT